MVSTAAAPPARVAMWYPMAWDERPTSRLLDEVGGRLREWAGTAALVPVGYPRDLVPLRHAELFACHSYPEGDPERLTVIARLLTLWTMDDDVSERWGIGEAHAQAVLGVLRGTSRPGADPYLREWASVGTALRDADMSEDWLRLFFGHLETWYASARRPERNLRETRDQYWRRRLDGTGAVPWLDLLEYVHRRELTPAQRNTEPVRNAYVFAAEDYVLAFNDPTSVERDARQQVPNLCTLIASERSISPAEAAAELARQHLLRVRRRQAEVAAARRTHPDLTWWLDRACVHHLGMARAHVPDRSRYGELQTVSGSSFRIRVITG